MNNYWKIRTEGDPLGALQQFITAVWERSNLKGMLVPLDDADGKQHQIQFIESPARISDINPFKPIMRENTARYVPSMLDRYRNSKIAAILRPCEMRALIEMVKHDSFSLDGLLTICIDCLKTIPESEYQWRRERKKSTGSLTKEVLQFARQGGIVAYRYRAACQMCISPQAKSADINVAVLGLPVRDQIIIQTDKEEIINLLALTGITDPNADPVLIDQHDHVVAKMDAWHYNRMKQVTESLDDILPKDLEGLMAQLESCAPCETCLDVCPICAIDRPVKDALGHYTGEDVTRWLLSCSGCGMCEQACPSHYPLNSIFREMREKLCQTFEYVPGISIEQSLPLA